jgi:hypothetical protein
LPQSNQQKPGQQQQTEMAQARHDKNTPMDEISPYVTINRTLKPNAFPDK